MKAKLILVARLLLLLTALAACSSTQGGSNGNAKAPAASMGKLDACLLLTKQDAEALMEEAAGAPSSSQVGDTVSRCGYVSASGSKRVSLLARRASSANEAIQIFRKAQAESKSLSGSDPQDIAGLGDAAYWAGGSLKQVNVLKGDLWLIVSASLGGDPLTENEAAAKKILAHT